MNEKERAQTPAETTEAENRKPWEPPQVEVLPIENTDMDFIALTDSTSFYS